LEEKSINKMNLLVNLLFYLILTILLEYIVYLLILNKKSFNLIVFVILINLVSWPISNFLSGFEINFYIIEIFVMLVEIPIIKILLNTRLSKSVFISLTANFFTAVTGFILKFLIN
jgi:hypothetical protein